MIDDSKVRCDAADACTAAIARGGTSGLISLVIDLSVERAALLDRIRRLESVAHVTRDTEPCGAPEDGGP